MIMTKNHQPLLRRPQLLELPLELLLKISEYLSFADLWYLATSSRHSRAVAYQIIWHRYHIDLSRPQLNTFNHIVHAALAYVTRHGYKNDIVDHTIIQSVSNRLAVEIYDRSPLKNWEPCLDFFLDKTLGIILDHVLLDPLLDTVPKHSSFSELRFPKKRKRTISSNLDQSDSNTNFSNNNNDQPLFASEFHSTRMGKLMTTFLTTLYPTMVALFEVEPTTEIHHRLLLNHIDRHLDNLSSRYHNHHRRRQLLNASPRPTRFTALTAVMQHNQLLKLNFRILTRFIGSLVQTDLLSINDLNLFIHERIQFFFLTFEQVIQTNGDVQQQEEEQRPLKKKAKYNQPQQQEQPEQKAKLYENIRNSSKFVKQMCLEEIEFKMEIFFDFHMATLTLRKQDQIEPRIEELNTVSAILNNTVTALISTEANNSHNQQVPVIISPSTTTTTTTNATTSAVV